MFARQDKQTAAAAAEYVPALQSVHVLAVEAPEVP
jgi:hypothetical protein